MERGLSGALSTAEGERAWLAEAPAKMTAEASAMGLPSALCLPRAVLPAGVLGEPAPALQSLDFQQPADGSP